MNKDKDLTKGNPFGLIFSFAFSMMMGNIFQQLYTVVDSIIIGKKINCKNYKTFYNSLSYLENPGDDETNPGDNQEKNDKKKSGLQTWIIIVIVIGGCIIIIGGIIFDY